MATVWSKLEQARFMRANESLFYEVKFQKFDFSLIFTLLLQRNMNAIFETLMVNLSLFFLLQKHAAYLWFRLQLYLGFYHILLLPVEKNPSIKITNKPVIIILIHYEYSIVYTPTKNKKCLAFLHNKNTLH